ncbi:MAG: TfoX/Sxy family protein [Pseudoxanthomonas sp.]
MSTDKLLNIGPRSAAWLRQVGLRTVEDVAAIGAVAAYVKVKRAGFRPSRNLLYSLEGALIGCHWQQLPDDRRAQLLAELETAEAQLPPPRGRPAAAPVTVTMHDEGGEMPAPDHFDAAEDDEG